MSVIHFYNGLMATWGSVPTCMPRRQVYVWLGLTQCVIIALILVSTTYFQIHPKLSRVDVTPTSNPEVHRTIRRNGFVESSNYPKIQGNTKNIGSVKSPNPKTQFGISRQPIDLEFQRYVSQLKIEKLTEDVEILTKANTPRPTSSREFEFKRNGSKTGSATSSGNVVVRPNVNSSMQRQYSNTDKDHSITNGTVLDRTARAQSKEMVQREINMAKQYQRLANESVSVPDESDDKEQTIGFINRIGLVKSQNHELEENVNRIGLVKSQSTEFQENTKTNGAKKRKERQYSNSDNDQTITNGNRRMLLRQKLSRTAHALLKEMTLRSINVTKQRLKYKSAPDETDDKDQTIVMGVPPWSEIHNSVDNVAVGGRFKPTKGLPQDTVVFIVPYRNRRLHLKLFLKHMHPFLQRQNLGYVIYVIEMQDDDVPFNRALLFNAGFLEVMKREVTSCVVFHDIDMLPTNDKNLYHCDNTVRHYAVAVQQYGYRLYYDSYIGGVLGFPPNYFRAVNGFSNLYEGWGIEDDDMYQRIMASKIPLSRPTQQIGRYDTWSHNRDMSHFNRNWGLLENATSRMKWDGLTNVRYKVKAFEERSLFTWILLQTSFQ